MAVSVVGQLRQRMREAEARAREEAAAAEPDAPSEPAEPSTEEPQVEVDFDLRESGERKTINGHDTREVVMTVTVREKGMTLEQSGGMVMTSHSWLGPRLDAIAEIAAFDRRYAEALELPFMTGADAEQMAAALAMYPGLSEAMGRFQAENVNLDGTPVLTEVTFDAVKSAADMAAAKEEAPPPARGGIGGLVGGLGRRMAGRDNADTGRATGTVRAAATAISSATTQPAEAPRSNP